MQDFLKLIEERKKSGTYRKLQIHNRDLISFSSNDYFGLADDERIKSAALKALEEYGVGAKSSRYLSGNTIIHDELEKEIALFKNTQSAVLFGSGYLTSVGVIPALVGRNDLIVADRLSHACLIDGAILSRAKLLRFNHNSVSSCEELLKKNRSNFGRCLIITETVFSMDGDVAPIDQLLELAHKYNCILVSDDAHGFGFIKTKTADNHLKLGTLSKAVGAYGGYAAGSSVICEFLTNFARSAIYTTALPTSIAAAATAAIKIIKEDATLAESAMNNAKYFCSTMNLETPSSQIVPLIVGDEKKAIAIANILKEKGILVSAVRYPTVEKGKARLRFSFCSNHKKPQIEQTACTLKNILQNAA